MQSTIALAQTNEVCAKTFVQSLLDSRTERTARELFGTYIFIHIFGSNVYGSAVWNSKTKQEKAAARTKAEIKLAKFFRKEIPVGTYIKSVRTKKSEVEVKIKKGLLGATLIFTPTNRVCKFGKISARFLGRTHELHK